jgi:hypothetical protein
VSQALSFAVYKETESVYQQYGYILSLTQYGKSDEFGQSAISWIIIEHRLETETSSE